MAGACKENFGSVQESLNFLSGTYPIVPSRKKSTVARQETGHIN